MVSALFVIPTSKPRTVEVTAMNRPRRQSNMR